MATNPETTLAAAPAPAPDTNFVFELPNSNSTKISIDYATIPQESRFELLKTAIRGYITNSANQANIKANKANEKFAQYDEAIKADPLQTAVAKPDEATRVDSVAAVMEAAVAARTRLYEGAMRKAGDGTKTRVTKDPLVKLVTDAVLREVFEKNKATSGYKWTDAVKEVGGDGVAYLNKRIDARVAAGGDRAALEKFRDERYVNPAKMMLGQKDSKTTKDQSLL